MTTIDISLVRADILSQWQAFFLQIFPLDFPALPQTHTSDRQCFETHWHGPPMSYEVFMAKAYPQFTPVPTVAP